jgi:hypothetical protein
MTNSATVGRPLPREDEAECHVSREGTVEFLGRDVSGQRPQYRGLLVERIAERAAQRDIPFDPVGQGFSEAAHDAPPGKGRATSASCGSATFT